MLIFDAKAIVERLKQLRNQHYGTRGRSKFARDLGISPSTYSYYESTRIPSIETLLKISEVTGADLHWLLTGEKTACESEKALSGGKRAFAFCPNSTLLRNLETVLSEHPELVEPIMAFAELLCEKKELEGKFVPGAGGGHIPAAKRLSSKVDRPGWIPVLGGTAAGLAHFWDETVLARPGQAVTELDELVRKHIGSSIVRCVDAKVAVDIQARALVDSIKATKANVIQLGSTEAQEIVEFVQCEEFFELYPDSFALRVDGDSMSPRVNDGDIVVLSPSVPAAQGQMAVVRLAGQIGVTCKLIRSTENDVHLIPINERYQTKVVNKKDLLWALAVLCHISL